MFFSYIFLILLALLFYLPVLSTLIFLLFLILGDVLLLTIEILSKKIIGLIIIRVMTTGVTFATIVGTMIMTFINIIPCALYWDTFVWFPAVSLVGQVSSVVSDFSSSLMMYDLVSRLVVFLTTILLSLLQILRTVLQADS